MKQILLQWMYHADIFNVTDDIADNLSFYQLEFDKWIGNKNNNHGYWVRVNPDDEGFVDALCFDTEAFISYLNKFVIRDNDQKVDYALKEIQPTNDQRKLPTIFF